MNSSNSFEAKLSIEFAFFAVCRITTTSPDMETGHNGTGFLMCINHAQENTRLLVVTNKHVVSDPTYHVAISLNGRDGNGSVELGSRVSASIVNFHRTYMAHPEEDLALIDITETPFSPSGPYVKYFDSADILLDADKLWPGMDIMYIGYPDGRFDTYNNLPLEVI